jgi:hypothetical protein
MQYHEKEVAALVGWLGAENVKYRPAIHLTQIWVAANEAWLPIQEGEWVLQDELGFYPCQDVVFRKKYHRIPNRDDELKPMRTLTLKGSEWDGFEFHSSTDEFWLGHNGFPDEEATRRYKELTKGYDRVVIDHTK